MGLARTPVGMMMIGLAALPLAAQRWDTKNSLAPYVPSPQNIVERMLEAANVRPGEMVYDLGCGDGRVLITAVQLYKAKAVGIELSPDLARQATDRLRVLHLDNDAKVVEANLLDVDLSPADVVVLYLLTESNEKLRPKLERLLHPGARVVSHDYEIRGWKPTKVEYVEAHRRRHKIYVYEIAKPK